MLLRPSLFRHDVSEVRTLHYAEGREVVDPPESLYWPGLVGGPYTLDGRLHHVYEDVPIIIVDDPRTDQKHLYVRQYINTGSKPALRFYAHESMPGRVAINQLWHELLARLDVI